MRPPPRTPPPFAWLIAIGLLGIGEHGIQKHGWQLAPPGVSIALHIDQRQHHRHVPSCFGESPPFFISLEPAPPAVRDKVMHRYPHHRGYDGSSYQIIIPKF